MKVDALYNLPVAVPMVLPYKEIGVCAELDLGLVWLPLVTCLDMLILKLSGPNSAQQLLEVPAICISNFIRIALA